CTASHSEIYTLSLHDALPILVILRSHLHQFAEPNHFEPGVFRDREVRRRPTCFFLKASAVWPICSHATLRKAFSKANSICASARDRKSTRLNSSHRTISYAVF